MILLKSPGGRQVLIDGGADPDGAVRALDDSTPFWDRSVDLVVLTHPEADHVGGLRAVLERYDVDMLLEAPEEHESAVYSDWRRLADAHPNRVIADAGLTIGLGDGVSLEVLSGGRSLAGDPLNDASVVLMARYGEVAFLLTGDITTLTEQRLIDSAMGLDATVLKVAHHGSDTSSIAPFTRAASPTVAVVQVGTENRFGHPTDAVMSRLAESVSEDAIFVTRERGDVTFSTDGTRLWAATER